MLTVHSVFKAGRNPQLSRGCYVSLTPLLVILCLLQGVKTLLLENGTYILCGSSAEQVAQHSARSIEGGVNTLHQLERTPCENLSRGQLRYRTYDGTCNAEANLGAAFSVVKRISATHYQGGKSGPRQWAQSGAPLPSARVVSLSAHRSRVSPTHYTLLTMQIGQFIDHDLSLVPVATEFDDTIRCCGVPEEERYFDCFPIWIPPNDPSFKDCMEFVRSDAVTLVNGTKLDPRVHLNAITAWVDASSVYGSDRDRVRSLRAKDGNGALLMTKLFKGNERLPKGHGEDCINVKSSHFCALSGDERVNEQPGLTAIHTVFHLEHNRLTRKLVEALLFRSGGSYSSFHVELFLQTAPLGTQERIFQIVRKVLGGLWQKIVYEEYIPLIIGPYLTDLYSLVPGRRMEHDTGVDPSISMEFLTAGFRFGHSLVSDMIFTNKLQSLRELFGTSVHNLEYYPKIIRGLVSFNNSAERFDASMVSSITEHLFANSQHSLGFDLAALNIQRGRDHGIPPYNAMRVHFGLKPKEEWDDFTHCGRALAAIYEHPNDVDLFTGGTCEQSMERGIVGETFGHILGQQFRDLKMGDRYFYETKNTFFGFTDSELKSLRKLRLSKVLCENSDMDWIQYDPFTHSHDYWNPLYPCSSYSDIDMWIWAEYLKDLL